MDEVQLPHGYSHFGEAVYFLPLVPRNPWYSFYRPRKDERLSRPWSHPVVLNTGPLDWESSTLTTRPLLHFFFFFLVFFTLFIDHFTLIRDHWVIMSITQLTFTCQANNGDTTKMCEICTKFTK